MKFRRALEQVRQGKGMRLPQWEDTFIVYMWQPQTELDIDKIYDNIKNCDKTIVRTTIACLRSIKEPYLYMKCSFGNVPWKASTTELNAEDWEIVDR